MNQVKIGLPVIIDKGSFLSTQQKSMHTQVISCIIAFAEKEAVSLSHFFVQKVFQISVTLGTLFGMQHTQLVLVVPFVAPAFD